MPFTYEIDEARRLVVLTATDPAPRHEWFATLERVSADPRYRAGFDLLYDRTRVTTVLNAQDVRDWMHRYAGLVRINRCGRLAYVVTKPVIYGMFRLAAAFANGEGATVDAIRTLDEAFTWLGRKTDAGDAKRPRSRCGTPYTEPPDATSRRSSAMS